jgi:hypothetical protein
MAASAGLRKTHPVIRFEDEFGSLGSNPTPRAMERKVYRDLFECREDNNVVNNLLFRECPDFVLRLTSADKVAVPITSICDHFYAGFFGCVRDPRYLAGVSHSALQVLTFYAPYWMASSLHKGSCVWSPEARDELFGDRDMSGIAIHAVRLLERVQAVAREVYHDRAFHNNFALPEYVDAELFRRHVFGALRNDPKLCANFSEYELQWLSEAVANQVYLAYH